MLGVREDCMSDETAAARRRVSELRERISCLDSAGQDLILREARSHMAWTNRPVPDEMLHDLYDLTKMGPTSNNGGPMRLVFVKSDEAKERLKPALMGSNIEKVETAPVTVIVAFDTEWYKHLPRLFPHDPEAARIMIGYFDQDPDLAEQDSFRNSSLQGGYLMIAARALGLDVGAISGFHNDKVDEVFFAGTSLKSNFLCNIGYGDLSGVFPRNPRYDFAEACEIV